jgi:hypothetical protein
VRDSIVATVLVLISIVPAGVTPASAQGIADVKLAEGKQVAGTVLRALQQCLQTKGPGSSCTLGEVGALANVNRTNGSTPDGRWFVAPGAALTLSGGGAAAMSGSVLVSGAAGRDTNGLAVSLYVSPGGNTFRCEMRSGVPPGPGGGQPC